VRRLAVGTARLGLGVALYGAIILVARPWPTVAGIMLTFPLLNGFTLALAPRDRLATTVSTMLLMPTLNGALCVVYLVVFLLMRPGEWPALWLVIALAAVWVAAVAAVLRAGLVVSASNQDAYARWCTLLLAAATLAVLALVPALAPSAISDAAWYEAISHNRWRIGLFAACLAGLIAFTELLHARAPSAGGDFWAALLGMLAGLPIVPLFGLYTIAGDETKGIDERLDVLAHMLVGVWLGPVVAIWFVIAFSRRLLRRP
jgi:hypothetical protein